MGRPLGLAALLVALLPGAARACAVCFGSMGPDMTRGFYWGVVILLFLPPVTIFSLAGLILLHVRKNRRLLQQDPAR